MKYKYMIQLFRQKDEDSPGIWQNTAWGAEELVEAERVFEAIRASKNKFAITRIRLVEILKEEECLKDI
jgi:hypothetical protein